MGHFDVMYTCEDCECKFVVSYGEPAVCPDCKSEDCTDFMDDWEWWSCE